MGYLIQAVLLMIAFAALTAYNRRNPGRYRRPPPQLFKKWSRQRRLVFVWCSMILLVVIVIPASITFVFLALDAESCNSIISVSSACNAAVRIPVALTLSTIIVVGVLKGSAVLARVQNYGRDFENN
jgi:hypothetical protein